MLSRFLGALSAVVVCVVISYAGEGNVTLNAWTNKEVYEEGDFVRLFVEIGNPFPDDFKCKVEIILSGPPTFPVVYLEKDYVVPGGKRIIRMPYIRKIDSGFFVPGLYTFRIGVLDTEGDVMVATVVHWQLQ